MATTTRPPLLSGRPRGEPSPAEVLARLVADQAREMEDDERGRALPPEHATVARESDLAEAGRRTRGASSASWSLDRLKPRKRSIGWGVPMLLVGLGEPWERVVHDAVRSGACECPGCAGRPLRLAEACVVCDRIGAEEAGFELPGLLGILNADADRLWPSTTRYRGTGRLAGGKGRRKAAAAR